VSRLNSQKWVIGDTLKARELEGFAVPWSCQLGNVAVVACWVGSHEEGKMRVRLRRGVNCWDKSSCGFLGRVYQKCARCSNHSHSSSEVAPDACVDMNGKRSVIVLDGLQT
jgi:hypothetical protein